MNLKQANQKIENAVVNGYQTIETAVVSGYRKIEDRFIDQFLAQEGESTEEARQRLRRQTQQMQEKNTDDKRRKNR